jgi:branched-chain amino acid transport system permease protein
MFSGVAGGLQACNEAANYAVFDAGVRHRVLNSYIGGVGSFRHSVPLMTFFGYAVSDATQRGCSIRHLVVLVMMYVPTGSGLFARALGCSAARPAGWRCPQP